MSTSTRSTSASARSSCGRKASSTRGESVIVATGASALWLGLDNETRLRGRGVSACATCDGFFFRGKKVAVVGGGDTALEEATFLTRFATEVVMLHRRDKFRGSKIMQDRALRTPRSRSSGTPRSRTSWARRRSRRCACATPKPARSATSRLDGLFLAIGYKPNTDAFKDWLEVDDMGYLTITDETHSKIDGVFVAGDVHDHRYRQAVTAAADGCKAAIDAERWLEAQGITEASTATAW